MPRLFFPLFLFVISVSSFATELPEIGTAVAEKDGEVVAPVFVRAQRDGLVFTVGDDMVVFKSEAKQLIRALHRANKTTPHGPNLRIRIEEGIARVSIFGEGEYGQRLFAQTSHLTEEAKELAQDWARVAHLLQERLWESQAKDKQVMRRVRAERLISYIPKKITTAADFLRYKAAPWIGPFGVFGAALSDAFFGTNVAESAMDYARSAVEATQGAVGLEGSDPGKFVLGTAGAGMAGLYAMGAVQRGASTQNGSRAMSLLRRPLQPFFTLLTRPLLFGNSHLNLNWDYLNTDKKNKFFAYGVPLGYLGLTDILFGNGFFKNVGGLFESGYDMVNKLTVDAPSLGHFVGEAGLYGTGVYLGSRLLTHGIRRFTSENEWQRESDGMALRKVGRVLGATLGVGALATLGLLAEAGLTKDGDVPISQYVRKHYPDAVDENFRTPFVIGDDFLEKVKAGEFDEVLRLSGDPAEDTPFQAKLRELVKRDHGSLEEFYDAVKAGVSDGASKIASVPVNCFNSAKGLLD